MRWTCGWPPLGLQSAYGRLTVGLRSAYIRLTFGLRSAYGRLTVGLRPAYGRLTVGLRSAYVRLTFGLRSAYGRLTFGLRSAYGRLTVGLRSAYGRLTAGLRPAYGRLTVGLRLVSVDVGTVVHRFLSQWGVFTYPQTFNNNNWRVDELTKTTIKSRRKTEDLTCKGRYTHEGLLENDDKNQDGCVSPRTCCRTNGNIYKINIHVQATSHAVCCRWLAQNVTWRKCSRSKLKGQLSRLW